MNDFTHLHVHSHYSLLDGLGKIRPLLERAKELEMNSLALTDHGSMYGAIEFVREANDAGIKPIIGLEAYIAPNGRMQKRGRIDANPRHLTLIAQNMQGYKNLITLTTTAHLEGYYYKPRIDYDLLAEHSEGIIVLSGCLNSDISKAIVEKREEDAERLLKWHVDVFGAKRFYLEVQHHPTLDEQNIVNEALVSYSKKYNLSLVATADTHYIHPEDAEAQDVLICVQTGKTVQEKDRLCMLGEDFSLKSPTEMKELWKQHPAAIDNSQKIADMCDITLEFGVNRLPSFPLEAGVTADMALRTLCEQNLFSRYKGEQLDEARERLDYELSVIEKTGFASYFLIVSDFVREAKQRGILVGPGRGSAAGSIVSFLTGITGLDPLYYNLLFERFLNPERVSMPDIDLDFADDRRDEIIEYVRDKYGPEHVAQIITFGTMAARAAIRDAGRALALPYTFCDRVAKAIPMFTNFEQALSKGSELRTLYDSDSQVKKLVDTAQKLEGVCRHASTHAAGVVITDEPLTEYVPLQYSSTSKDTNQIVTQYAMNEVEALGLLKMDFLGLKNLTVIQNALKRIQDRYGIEINLDTLPLDDGLTYALLQEGKTTGVFQLESAGMKRYLKELKPTEFEDIISIGALYRPGPMDSIPDFIAAKHGRKKITYLHPLLKPILEKTYGVIVTQDQVLQIAREFAGFSYAQADILRKAVGKKIKKLLDEQREKFIKGAIEAKNIDRKTARKVWDFIEPFARYGFNRAHAACYAMIAYQTAYLKAHYPAEFMAALMTSDEGIIERQAIEVTEALTMNIKVLPPDINQSYQDFTVVTENKEDAIRFGLGAIKNVGAGVVAALIKEREENGAFKDIFDLFRRIDSRDFNRKSVESLAKAGAFDAMVERNFALEHVDRLLAFNRSLHRKIDAGQQGLFGGDVTSLPQARIELAPTPAATKDERLAWEKDLLGLYLSEHPLSELQQDLEKIATPLVTLKQVRLNALVRVAGVVTRLKKIITKSQKPMLFATIEDMAGTIEVLVFPNLYETTSHLWEDGAKVLVEGKVSHKDNEVKILADTMWVLTAQVLPQIISSLTPLQTRATPVSTAARLQSAQYITLQLPITMRREQLQQLRDVLLKHHDKNQGDLEIRVALQRDNKFATAKVFRVLRDEQLVSALTRIVGEAAILYS